MRSQGKKMIKFGLIGCGTHAVAAVIPAMEKVAGLELAAVCDLSADRLGQVKYSRGSPQRYTDYRKMLDSEKLDAVYIATNCAFHCDLAVLALKSGRHAVTEKPMAMSAEECRRMLAAAQAAGKTLVVDFESRYKETSRMIRKWAVEEKRLGAVHAVHIDHFWDGHKASGNLAARRAAFLEASGSLDCGIHKLDLARYFTGGGSWTRIHAAGAWFGEKARFAPHISIQAVLDCGTLVTLNNSFAYTAYISRRAIYGSTIVVGTKGVIEEYFDNATHRESVRIVCDTLEETVTERAAGGHGNHISMMLSDLCGSLASGAPLPPTIATGEDGLMAQVIADEANRQALEEGDVCQLRAAQPPGA